MSNARADLRARYIMIGGFLGAGKTTAVAQLARELTAQGRRIGLITNDQSTGLVDTAILRGRGFSVEEIAGGCFCCRFRSLSEAAERLDEKNKPELFLAEPVGSCTDLVATVSYPLRRLYGDRYTIAPLSVLVDPVRAERVLGLVEGRSFSSKVTYVYRKQLEEADVIVINKIDLLDEGRRKRLIAALQTEFPRAKVFEISAKDQVGLKEWFDEILGCEATTAPTMELDYKEYAEGEALLGWLNTTLDVEAVRPLDANELLLKMTEILQEKLAEDGAEIAHLKMTLDPEGGEGQLSVVSLVGTDREPDVRESLFDRIDRGSLILNLRAEADPESLRRRTLEALEEIQSAHEGLRIQVEHLEHFRPAEPKPTHRLRISRDGDVRSAVGE